MINLTFLGTGTSYGVPMLDCMMTDYVNCPQDVCQLARQDPKHRRLRASLLIETEDQTILIDVTPDFRQQMLNHQVKKIDAVLLTHHHSDHIQGFPDIRSYCQQGNPLDVYGPAETIDLLKQRFDYIFNPPPIIAGGIPDLTPHSKRAGERFEVCGLEITPGFVEHGSVQECFGYRLGDKIGYIPDVKVMPEETKALFQDLDILILNMLRRAPEHSTHLTLAQSVALAKELNPKQCYFVHMSHDIHYEKDQQALPPQMMFTYDGLQVKVEV